MAKNVTFEGHTLCQCQTIDIEMSSLPPKNFFLLNSYKNGINVSSLIEILQLRNFGHVTTPTLYFKLGNMVMLVASLTEIMTR